MRIGGKVEVFTPRTIKGWLAIFGDNRIERLKLEVLLDNSLLATATAEEYRADIALVGYGDGRCQFRITLPDALKDEELQRIQLRIKDSDVLLELPRFPLLREEDVSISDKSSVASPVFIVGSPRSGTSVLTRVLRGVGYHGFDEGNLLGLSQIIEKNIDLYFASYNRNIPESLLANINIIDLKTHLFAVFKDILEKNNPQKPWFDKTGNPEVILGLPRIMDAWPSSQVIFAKRHGIENISSRLIKFPSFDFTYHCEDWANNMRAWRSTRDQLDPSRIIEVDQREFLDTPELVAAKLAAFLNIAEDKQSSIEKVLRTERPQESFPGSAAKKMRIHDIGWTDEQVEIFEKCCSEEMVFFGYHNI